MTFDGLLLIDKEKGWSSFDVVAKVRAVLSREYESVYGERRKVKVGHTGTLDPLATGLMIVVVGSYCKRAAEFSKLDKTYEVTMKLGETSTTGDKEGQKTKVKSLKIKEERLLEVLDSFKGESMQVPPAHSAVKVGGQRAYKLARQGKEVRIEPRKINIYSMKMDTYEYPYVNFTVHVSSGTYIRSLVEDIGKELDTGAYMSDLRRTVVGSFAIEEAVNVEETSAVRLIKV